VEHAAADAADLQKKSLVAAERLRPDVAAARDAFFAVALAGVALRDVVVLDESYATTEFTRLRGRSPRGTRLVARVPHGHWKLLTVLAAMSVSGVVCAATVDAATDTDVFVTFVRDALCPALRPGQVVVMDNLAAHKGRGHRQGDRVGRLPARLSPAVLAGLQPDRADVVEGETGTAHHCRPHRRDTGPGDLRRVENDHASRLQRLLRPLRLHATSEMKTL
jgi:hypothetical protein